MEELEIIVMPAQDTPNRRGRIYPRAVRKQAVDRLGGGCLEVRDEKGKHIPGLVVDRVRMDSDGSLVCRLTAIDGFPDNLSDFTLGAIHLVPKANDTFHLTEV